MVRSALPTVVWCHCGRLVWTGYTEIHHPACAAAGCCHSSAGSVATGGRVVQSEMLCGGGQLAEQRVAREREGLGMEVPISPAGWYYVPVDMQRSMFVYGVDDGDDPW